MTNIDLSQMHTNQRLLVEELLRRGATISQTDPSVELLEVSYKGKSEYLLDRVGKTMAYLPSSLAADKHLTKYILKKHGVSVPAGHIFDGSQIREAITYGCELGFPLVIKPNVGSNGDAVHSGIDNKTQLEEAIRVTLHRMGATKHFIVEQHIHGSEYRIFVTTKGAYAVLLREPAHVIGDGKSSIETLAQQETLRRHTAKTREGSALCPIVLDEIALNFLQNKCLDFNSVPRAGEKIYLRLSSNLAQGGLSKDMTDATHPSAIAIAKKALTAFDGLPCLGVDFLTEDITADQTLVSHAILEINANPGLAMHHMPALGQPRNVASYLADVMFPDL